MGQHYEKSHFHAVLTIAITGFAAAIAQIVVLRELLVLFYGIEICVGIVFAAWLIWNAVGCRLAAWLTRAKAASVSILASSAILAAIMLPATVFFIRAARIIWSIAPGELAPLSHVLQICLIATALFCLLSGALFALCWAFVPRGTSPAQSARPLSVYIGEAGGAAAGGIGFYWLVYEQFSVLTIVWVASGMLLITAGWLLFIHRGSITGKTAHFLWALAASAVAAGLVFTARIDTATRHWQWGSALKAVTDTAYQNIALTQTPHQASIYTNGLWAFSMPDPISRENAVHPTLLQHPGPQTVLILGGSVSGLAEEVLKHPTVKRIDAVEIDPALVGFVHRHLPARAPIPENISPIQFHYQDAASFIRTPGDAYDVIILTIGDPVNAGMNRFYTQSFYGTIRKRLATGGIFSLGVSGGEDMIGDAQIQHLRAVHRTLKTIFPSVLVLPGNPVRFLATDIPGVLSDDYQVLAERIYSRGLFLAHVREDTLQDTLGMFRMQYFKTLLGAESDRLINQDFLPRCYINALMLWASHWHPSLKHLIAGLSNLSMGKFWAGVILVKIGLLLMMAFVRFRFKTAVGAGVMVVGMTTMVVQLSLILVFQILVGAVYLYLALIVAAVMAGLGLGAGWVNRAHDQGQFANAHRGWLSTVQLAACIYPVFLIGLFLLVSGPLRPIITDKHLTLLFICLSLLAGLLGGAHFSLATLASAPSEKLQSLGGRLYALDLAGSAGGTLLATVITIPALGPLHTLAALGILGAISVIALVRSN